VVASSQETAGRSAERVIELSAFVAAPLAGMTLARLGCDVVRVDPPGGGLDFGRWPVTPLGKSLFWAGLNRGKRSVVIDFRRPEGQELVVALIIAGVPYGESDQPSGGMLLTNLGASGPFQHSSLRQSRPDVISVEIEGYPDGRSAVDYTVAAGSGVPLLTGPEDHLGPVNSPLPTWDIATGLTAAVAAREAIWRRRETGSGARVRIALADVALDLLYSLGFVDEERLAAQPRKRDGNYLYGAFGRDFQLADGARVMVVAITPKQWRSLVNALGISEDIRRIEATCGLDLNREGDRWYARHQIAALVERWCLDRKLDEAAEVFDAYEVCWGQYGTASAILSRVASSHLRDRSSPVRFEDELTVDLGPTPRLGEHTEEVLTEVLGLAQYEIGKLCDNAIIAGAGPNCAGA
jgi:2-methylfumaryl-CoA isomerase